MTTAPRHDLRNRSRKRPRYIRHMWEGKARGELVVSVSPGRMQTPPRGSTP
jgi:hypothetical protein